MDRASNFRRIERLFHEACDLPLKDRDAFLDRECRGDPSLRHELQGLLERDAGAQTADLAIVLEDPSSSDSLVGRKISHYRVEREIGAGGMGVVYLAHDDALDRPVALKTLRLDLENAQAYLEREAQTCMRLQHPYIATFHEAGEAGGVSFAAFEYVAGNTLRVRLQRGPLSLTEALEITSALLEALGHAHAAGVLHRDIKPENVMLTEQGTPKLLDFGIARIVAATEEQATLAPLTVAGRFIGTPGFAAPEQVRGLAVGVRADLFALGALLFELVTGRPAFPGQTSADRIAAVLAGEAAWQDDTAVSSDLSVVLRRALASNPEQRFPDASAFLSALRALSPEGQASPDRPATLAVLDLRNLSADREDEWIGSGIAEALGTDLSTGADLRVVSREKVVRTLRQQASDDLDELRIGQLLGCRWLVCGGFQRLENALRITIRVIEVATGRVLAVSKVDGLLEELFAMQDRLSAETLEALAVARPVASPAAPDIDAFELNARGRRLWLQLQKGTLVEAKGLFERAARADPEYAAPLIGLAGVTAMRFVFDTDVRHLAEAERYARRAIELDPSSGAAYGWLAYALLRQGDLAVALESARTAMELDPHDFFGPYHAAAASSIAGRHAEALRYFRRTLEIYPDHPWSWLGLGWLHVARNRFEEGLWALEQAVRLERRDDVTDVIDGAEGFLAEGLRRAGRLDEAREAASRGLRRIEQSDHMFRDTIRGICLCALGRTAHLQGDSEAARAAFSQVCTHIRGRPRALGAGHILVQAGAELAGLERDAGAFEEFSRLFDERERYDFSFLWSCSDDVTLVSLMRGATALGRTEQARALGERAVRAGSREAEVILADTA